MDTKCLEIRRALTTDPKSKDSAIVEHLAKCTDCANYLHEIKLFENKLSSAMKIEVPEGLESRIILAQRMGQNQISKTSKRRNYTWMSMAAGIVLAIGLSIGIYKLGQNSSLEDQVLAHVYNELFILERDENVQLAALNILLKQHGIKANEGIGYVRFAENCPFGDHVVPHFILDDNGNAVTVMYLSWENIGKRSLLDDKRFKGILVAAESGTFVILSEDREQLHALEERVTSSIEMQI